MTEPSPRPTDTPAIPHSPERPTPHTPTMTRIANAWIAPSAVVIGQVTLGRDASIWPGAILRGDVAPITLGRRVNVQDGSILHCGYDTPMTIADDVVIAHHVVLHGRCVGARTLIGNHATILDDAQIGGDCLIAAGAVLSPGTIIPDGSVVMGLPARVVRPIRDTERAYIARIVAGYLDLARRHAEGEFPSLGA